MEGANITFFFHFINNSSGTGIAQLQTSLEHRNRSLSCLQNDIHSCGKHLVSIHLLSTRLRIRSAGSLLSGLLRLFLDIFQYLLVVFSRIVRLDIACNSFYFSICNKAALNTQGFAISDGGIKHIALAYQLFCTLRIQNDSGFHSRSHREGNTGRNICLHQTCNHICRGTLGRNNQVHSSSATHLGNTANGIFHFFCCNQHQVCKLVDDDYHGGQFFAILFGKCNAVIGFQISNASIRHDLISTHHFGNCPLQAACSLLRIRNNRNEQMRNTVIDAELHHLGVNHNQLHIFRAGLVQQAENDGVHTHRLTGTGGTGN